MKYQHKLRREVIHMAEFMGSIRTDNAAFGEDGADAGAEVARILRGLADHIEADQSDFSVGDTYVMYDINGNKVGSFEWKGE